MGKGLPTDGEWNSSVSKSKTKTKVRVVYEVVNEIMQKYVTDEYWEGKGGKEGTK